MSKKLDHMKATGYRINGKRIEHRDVYQNEQRKIPPGWCIHHIDHNRQNNHISNLVAVPVDLHNYIHHIQNLTGVTFTKREIESVTDKIELRYAALRGEIKIKQQHIERIKLNLKNLGFHEIDDLIDTARPLACHDNPCAPKPFVPKVILRSKS